jgi:predicted PurR-regulated permease PerM
MIKKIFFSTILILFFLFFFLIFREYMSENTVKIINKNRNNINKQLVEKTLNLDTLSNDTNNVIEFNTGYDSKDNIKKKRNFWELFKK